MVRKDKRDESRISREEMHRFRNSGMYDRLPRPTPGPAKEILEFYKPKSDDNVKDETGSSSIRSDRLSD